MLMETHSCFWKLGECIRVPTVVWTEIDGVSKIGSEQKQGAKKKDRTFKHNKVSEATNLPLSPAT